MKKKRKKDKNLEGITRLASFTGKSISSAYELYKKRQKIKKIENARLEKIGEKKELKLREDQIFKDREKLKLKEEELKLKEKQNKLKYDEQRLKEEKLNQRELELKERIEELNLITKEQKNKEKQFKLKEDEIKRKNVDLKVREEEQKLKEKREYRKKYREHKVKTQVEQRLRDIELQRIKEWEEKFDNEQRLQEQLELLKEEKIKLKDQQKKLNISTDSEINKKLSPNLESFEIDKTRKN